MSDILQDLTVALQHQQDRIRETGSGHELYILLSRAVGEIERLRKSNSDMGWKLNPDRMGGQFTEWEINRRGDDWS